ncbi:MAG: hypothetical protein ACXW30_05805 [Micavibrio sp.]
MTIDFNKAAEWVPNGCAILTDRPAAFGDHPDIARLSDFGCGALSIGMVPDPEKFSSPEPDVEFAADFTMIKQAGSDVYHLPRAFANYEKTLMTIAEDQDVRSENARNKYAFVFLQRSFVRAGQFQRNDNWHRDSMPRDITSQYKCGKDAPCSIYLVSDIVPTVVQTEGVEKASALFQFGTEDKIAPHSRALKPYEIALMNQYVFHRGDLAKADCMRNFLVVMYAERDRPQPQGWRALFPHRG